VQRTRTTPRLAVAFAGLAIAGIVAFVLLSGGSGTKSSPVTKPAAAGPVTVRLTDFKISPSASTVSAGKVTFAATNTGKVEHEMVVVRTDQHPSQLLHGARASEAGSVGEISETKPGAAKRVTLNLKPGHYLLLCNVPGHFKAGMFKNFIVK
jgi:uncharacterized cupredoxin-like copper-binding protein